MNPFRQIALVAASIILPLLAPAEAAFTAKKPTTPPAPIASPLIADTPIPFAEAIQAFRDGNPRFTRPMSQEAAREYGADPDQAYAKARKATILARRALRGLFTIDPAPNGYHGNALFDQLSNPAFHQIFDYTYRTYATLSLAEIRRRPQDTVALTQESFVALQAMGVSDTSLTIAQNWAATGKGDPETARLARVQQEAFRAWRAGSNDTEDDGLRKAFETAHEALIRHDTDYFLTLLPRLIGFEEVRRHLDPDEALILLFSDPAHVFVIAVSKQGIASTVEYVDDDLRNEIRRLRCDLDAPNCTADIRSTTSTPFAARGYDSYDLATAHRLYAKLFGPLERVILPVRRLAIVSSGFLSDIPFAALNLNPPPPGADFADPAVLKAASWMGDRYAITMLPSVQSLTFRAPPAAPAPLAFVGYGDPALLGPLGIPLRSAITRLRGVDATRTGIDPANVRMLPPLPGTKLELERTAALFGPDRSRLRLGNDATEAAIRSDADLGKARFVTIATHGLLPGEIAGSQEPTLVMTPPKGLGPAAPTSDGLLSAGEVLDLRFNADWVILSACNSASNGDGLSALARSFLAVGADALLASHWRVSDEVTATLTVEILRQREAGQSRATSLQRAARAIRTGRRADGSPVEGWQDYWVHPNLWAPFSLYANRAD